METFSCQFEKCARKFPDNTAILYCVNNNIINRFTYTDLLKITDNIYDVLIKHVNKFSCVAFLTEYNPILSALIISIHKHQSTFICLDNITSETDILNIVNRIGIQWILHYNSININIDLKLHATLVDRISLVDNNYTFELWKISNTHEKIYKNIAYVIRTSGTTGTNKIVKVFHDCIMSNIDSLRNIFDINAKDIIPLVTSLSFDPFIIEIMLALTSGATLLIMPNSVKFNKNIFIQTLFPENKTIHSGITFLQMCPSVFLTSKHLINKIINKESSLRILALGGEKFPENILQYKNQPKNLRIFNLYGITEVSCWASIEEILPDTSKISLGTVLNDTFFQVRDSDGNKVENDEGELFIGSDKRICLINDEINFTGNIIYRATGDLVRFDKTTNKYFYIGRKNNIVKRFGHRINLTEIEKFVFNATDLNSICIWNETNSKLILFIILQETDSLIKNKIIDRLRIKLLHSLSSANNPDQIEIISSIPLTQNGKTDTNTLLEIVNFNRHLDLNPKDIFRKLWSKYFSISQLEIEQNQAMINFRNQGGNSILAIQLISEFDSYVENNYSAELLTLLLDEKLVYKNYYDFIEDKSELYKNTKRPIDSLENASKHLKVENSLNLLSKFESKSNITNLIILWKHDLKACVDSTPVYFYHNSLGGLITVGSHAYIFTILIANSGKLLSQTILKNAIEGSPCISPCKNFALIGCLAGTLYNIKIETGDILWEFETKSSIKTTPTLCSDNKNIIFGSYDKSIYCLKLEDGTLIRKNDIGESIKSNIILNEKNNLCYVATLQGTCICFCAKTNEIIWKQKMNSCVFGSPCLIEEENVILWADVKGHVCCFDCDNGDKLWTYKSQGFIYSSLCKYQRRILFGCIDQHIYCLECARGNYKEAFRINIGAPISTTPCIFHLNNRLHFLVSHNKGTLHLFDFENVNLLCTLALPGEIFSSAVVDDDKIYVGCRDNNVYCIVIQI